jgi:hypothetical protein
MSNIQLYVGALLVLIGYVVISAILKALISPLRSISGPFLARFTRLWELGAVLKYDFATYNIALHDRYGAFIVCFFDICLYE